MNTAVNRERHAEYLDLQRVVAPAFWAGFDQDPLAALEFLENRIAPLALDGGFTFVRYVGTDLDAFQEAFPGMRIVEGTMVPKGRRGILLAQALRRGLAEAQDRAAPRQDQGRPRDPAASASPATRSCSAG